MKWKMIFIFLTGFWLHELLAHIWLAYDGLLPLKSTLFGMTITPELNSFAIVVNTLLLIAFAYLGLWHNWEHALHAKREA